MGGSNGRTDISIVHSLNVLERIISGEFPVPEGTYNSTRLKVEARYFGKVGSGRPEQNLAFVLLSNHPRKCHHDTFDNGYIPLAGSALAQKVKESGGAWVR